MADGAEREEILQALRENAAAFKVETDRHDETIDRLRAELFELLERGRAARIGRKAMSKAAGLTLPSLSKLLDHD